MKKTITSLALLASASSAFGLVEPPDEDKAQPTIKIACFATYTAKDGSTFLNSCDESENNKTEKRKLKENTCAEGQVAQYYILGETQIKSCMPPGMVQL